MIESAKLTINLDPVLRDYLLLVSEEKKISPSNLATEILECCLSKDFCRSRSIGASGSQPVERRRPSLPLYNPEEVVADIQRSLEALSEALPGFASGGPLAAEVEAIISQVESERKND